MSGARATSVRKSSTSFVPVRNATPRYLAPASPVSLRLAIMPKNPGRKRRSVLRDGPDPIDVFVGQTTNRSSLWVIDQAGRPGRTVTRLHNHC